MIAINRFKFNNYSSVDFDLITDLCFEGGDNGETSTFLQKEANSSERYDGTFHNVTRYKYNETLNPTIMLIKQGFGDFSMEENRRILAWLTSKHTASWLTVYHDDSEVVSYELLGGFSSVEAYKLGNGRIVGYICQWESVSPYAYSPIKTITQTITSPTVMNIKCNTDEWEAPVYPKITIKQSNDTVVNITSAMASTIFNNDNYIDGTVYHCDGTYYWKAVDDNGQIVSYTNTTNDSGLQTTSVMLYNETANVKTYIKGNTANETIIIDGANRVVSTENDSRSVLGNDFAWEWLPLMYGDNKIRIVGNCEITLMWREPIKPGDY